MSAFPIIRNDADTIAAICAGVPSHFVQDPITLAISLQTDPCAVIRDKNGCVEKVVCLMSRPARRTHQ